MSHRSSLSLSHKIKLNGIFFLLLLLLSIRNQKQTEERARDRISFLHQHTTDIYNGTNQIDEEEIGAVPHSSMPMSVKACETEMCEMMFHFVSLFYGIVYGVCYITHVVPEFLGCHIFRYIYTYTANVVLTDFDSREYVSLSIDYPPLYMLAKTNHF